MGDVTACIAPYADTNSDTAKAARSGENTSSGIEYILTLNAATAKKLSDMPTAANVASGAQGIRAVTRQAVAAMAHTRIRALTGSEPARIARNESVPPAS